MDETQTIEVKTADDYYQLRKLFDRYCRALHHISDAYAGDLSVDECQRIASRALDA